MPLLAVASSRKPATPQVGIGPNTQVRGVDVPVRGTAHALGQDGPVAGARSATQPGHTVQVGETGDAVRTGQTVAQLLKLRRSYQDPSRHGSASPV